MQLNPMECYSTACIIMYGSCEPPDGVIMRNNLMCNVGVPSTPVFKEIVQEGDDTPDVDCIGDDDSGCHLRDNRWRGGRRSQEEALIKRSAVSMAAQLAAQKRSETKKIPE